MEIGIIGAGQIGGTLTRLLTKQGHTVKVSNSRAPETLADLAAETGATAVWAKDAPVDADLVIVSIPQKNTPDLAEGIVSTRKPGAPVLETNNYYPRERDGRIEAIEDHPVGRRVVAAWVAEQAPQCGYCQSGQVMAATALLAATPRPTPEQVEAAMTNICRCGTYNAIGRAIAAAAEAG